MWFEEAVFYQIYPLGLCRGAKIDRVEEWIPHMVRLGVDAVYFCPVFSSDNHGYDTRDYSLVDPRLGTNAQFARVCDALHEQGIRVVLDGVFNHVGRGFWAFEDVRKNRQASPYRDWFTLDFGRNSNDNDGFWYEGWEGHYELVKLNLGNPEVQQHIFSCVRAWHREFGIDGLRLDVAYLLPEAFLEALRQECKAIDEEFFLVGETIHGDYNRVIGPGRLDSCTNYECYKGLYSSFNDKNMYEIAHSLNRQFGSEHWTLYRERHLLCFADNHDVSRIMTLLKDKEDIVPLYALLFGMPGIPCLYYGSEWGAEGDKKDGDDTLRPAFAAPVENALTKQVAVFAGIHRESRALCHGSYRQIYLTNSQFVFAREHGEETVLVAVNAGADAHKARLNIPGKRLKNLATGRELPFDGSLEMEGHSGGFFQILA